MRTVLLRFHLLFIFLAPVVSTFAQSQDSIWFLVQPVQCFGLRNGEIKITEVLWGTSPYYFSLDGQSYSTRPVFDLLWAGEYNVYVRDSSGREEKYPVLVPEPPELKVSISVDDTSIVAGEWFHLKATVYPPGSVLTSIDWRPSDLITIPGQLNQLVRISDSTVFAIEIQNKNECIARDDIFIPVEKTNLYFPNCFDPNSNQNNYFTVFSGDGVARIDYLQVFSRTGQMMFERRSFFPNDPLSGWNGKYRGRLAPAGAYVWVAQIEYLNGTKQQYSGTVTLID